MRLGWKLCSPALSQLLQGRVTVGRTTRRTGQLLQGRVTVGRTTRRTSQLLQGRVTARRTARRTTSLITNKPITKVQTIVIKASSKHPALQKTASQTFSDLHLREDVVDALNSVGLCRPTVTQMLTIPHILKGRNVLCAAETGSGKTIAYLAPLISQLRREEAEEGVVPRLRRPRALIVLPSRALASQVLAVAKSLCHVARFRAVGFIRGGNNRNIRNCLVNPVDVAITTPDALLKFRREKQIHLTDLRYLVVDEADTMFDRSFQAATTSIIQTVKDFTTRPTGSHLVSHSPSRHKGAQVITVAATLSTQMMRTVESLVSNVKVVTTKSLHRILPHIEQRFYKVAQAEKADKLLTIVRDHPSDVFMIFCNTVSSCDWATHFLQSNGIPVTTLHAGFRASRRKDLMQPFCDGETRVLVCTDLASRGIHHDKVNHVVLFDFPHTILDYLHRVGRTGRVGSSAAKCRASILMTHRNDVRIAWQIKDAADRREAITNQKMNRRLQSFA